MSSKNTSPFAGRFGFSWHPAPAGNCNAALIALFCVTTLFSGSHLGVRSILLWRRQAARWPHGQPWFYLRLAPGRGTMALWGCPREHTVALETFRLSRPGYLPSNPCAQLLNLRTSGLQLRTSWWGALMLFVASDVRPRTSLLSSTGSGQSPPSYGPASIAPWPAAFRWQLCFRRTRGTDRPSRSPWWQRS